MTKFNKVNYYISNQFMAAVVIWLQFFENECKNILIIFYEVFKTLTWQW